MKKKNLIWFKTSESLLNIKSTKNGYSISINIDSMEI